MCRSDPFDTTRLTDGEWKSWVTNNVLPSAPEWTKGYLVPGLLSFFYDTESCPKDSQGWEVLFHDGPISSLARAPMPGWLSQDSLLPVCSLEFVKVESMPALNSPALASVQLTANLRERYARLLKALCWPSGREIAVHRLLGYSDTIQNDMGLECAMASAGPDVDSRRYLKDAKHRRMAAAAKDWTLLLQLDSEPRMGLEWADAGRLYYWIRNQDLASRRFHCCWAILQSY